MSASWGPRVSFLDEQETPKWKGLTIPSEDS